MSNDQHPDTCAMYQHQTQCAIERGAPEAGCTCSPSIDERHCDCHVGEIAALNKENQRLKEKFDSMVRAFKAVIAAQSEQFKLREKAEKERDELLELVKERNGER